jgi:hypothetical protein
MSANICIYGRTNNCHVSQYDHLISIAKTGHIGKQSSQWVHLLSSTSIKRLFKDKASRGQIATQAAQPKQRESLMISK